MQPIKIGLLGAGVVGAGVAQVLARNQEEISRRAGRGLVISRAAVRNVEKARKILGEQIDITTDVTSVVRDPNVHVIIEVIGGDTLAKDAVLEAIAHGKHVVTANKALLAKHGSEIFAAAEKRGVMVAFEAAVAGGIPIIKSIREGLSANRVEWVAGIINGTTNFILSQMREKKLPFDQVLKQAQALGYAEADPTFDVQGVDAAHKLALLCAIAFGVPVQFDQAYIEGITELTAQDIQYAQELGYRIKLIGMTKRRDSGIELRVHPTLVPQHRLIANVEGPMNAVLVMADAVGATMYYGQGAGAEPTASAVVADLVDVTRLMTADPAHRVPYLAFKSDKLANTPILPMDQVITSYYLRMQVSDEPGVMADITRILADLRISIDALLQKEPAEGEQKTDVIILTHEALEADVNAAIAKIQSLRTVLGKVTRIRLESLA